MILLSYSDVAIGTLLAIASLGLVLVERLGLARDVIVGTLRAFLQLTAVGFVLAALFQNVHPAWMGLALVIMISAAVQAARGRITGIPRLTPDLTLAIGGASLVTLTVVVLVVIRPPTWYDPQVVIPLGGMVIGNTMNVAALTSNRFAADVRHRQDEIEALLALGATRDQALQQIGRDSVRAALVPSVAGMMVVGIVALPGTMTGQILAGADPTQAVRYQIVVQYMILFAAIATAVVQVRLIRRQFFTPAHQLRLDLLRDEPDRGPRQRQFWWRLLRLLP